jgi:hypothetical protein
MESKNIYIFKMISGWGVSLPVYYYQNPDELVEKMRSFQDKLNDSFNNDPILDKILKEAKVNKSEKNTYKISTVNDNLFLYFPKKQQALFFIDLIMEEDGSQNKELDIEEAYKVSIKQITQ